MSGRVNDRCAVRRPTPRRRWGGGSPRLVLGGLAMILLASGGVRGEPPQPPVPGPLSFRRVYLPEDAIPSQQGVYLPVERDEFERLLQTIRGRYLAPQVSLRPQLQTATYTARLEGPKLIRGTAELSIMHRDTEPGMVLLEPFGLAIEDAQWRPAVTPVESDDPDAAADATDSSLGAAGTETAAGTEQPATLGSDESGRTLAVIPGSGTLHLEWALLGRRGGMGELAFPLRLPASPVTRLFLTLPGDLLPIVKGGLVSRVARDEAVEGGEAEWLIQLQGTADAVLTLVAKSATEYSRSLMLLSEATEYRLQQAGLTAVHAFQLDVYHQPIHLLNVELEPQLRLMSARVGGRDVAWTEATTNSVRQVTLEFTEPLQGPGQTLVLTTMGDVRTGELWSLPRVEVPSADWLSGTVEVVAEQPLEVVQLETSDVVPSHTNSPEEAAGAERIQLERLTAGGDIRVVLRRQAGQLMVKSGTTVSIGETTTQARQVVEVATTGPGPFSLDFETAPEWTIDLIEVDPPERLEEWQPIRLANGQHVTRVVLREGLSPERPLRVLLHGHRRGLRGGNWLSGRDVRLATLRDARKSRYLVTLSADAPNRVDVLGGKELVRLDPAELSADEQELVSVSAGGVLYVDDRAAEQVAILVRSEPPRYRAEIALRAEFDPQLVQYRAEIRCVPQGGALQKLEVQLTDTEGPRDEVSWKIQSEDELQLQAARAAEDTSDTERMAGDTWELVLSGPTERPFTVSAQWSEPSSAEVQVPLLLVRRAASQTGLVTIYGRGALPLRIQSENLKSIPVEPFSRDRYTTCRGAFRYEPMQDSRLSVSRAGSAGLSAAWVWSLQLTTRCYEDGRNLHEAQLLIENTGAASAVLRIQPRAELTQLLVDGVVSGALGEREPGQVVVPLPEGVRYPAITLRYVTRDAAMSRVAEVQPVWPDVDLLVLERRWELVLPAAFALDPAGDVGRHANPWWHRLFGPLLATRPLYSQPDAEAVWRELVGLQADPQNVPAGSRNASRSLLLPTRDGSLARWKLPYDDESLAIDLRGWTRHLIELPPNDSAGAAETKVCIFRREVFTAAAWAVLLTFLGFAGWTASRRRLWALPLVAATGLVALFAPSLTQPLATAAFLGTLAASLLVLLWPRPSIPVSRPARDHSSRRVSTVLRVATAWFLLAFLVLSAALAFAQSALPDAAATPASPVYRVLCPTDDQKQPLGEYVFVPEAFHDTLIREASVNTVTPREWLIRHAEYRLMFEWQVADERIDANEMLATYRLEVFRPGGKVTLPMDADRLYLLPNRARLDGRPASVYWEAEGRGLSIEVPQPGEVTLELAFRPQTLREHDQLVLETSVPPVPQSQVRLYLPVDVPDAECPYALGGSRRDDQTGEQVIALGPSDRLRLQWPNDIRWTAQAPDIELTQRMWMDVRPGAVQLTARFEVSASPGRVRYVDFRVDPRLQVLPPDDAQPITGHYRRDPATDTLRVLLDHRPPAELKFELRFVMVRDAIDHGLRPPTLLAVSARTRQRLLAVTIDPLLSSEIPAAVAWEETDLQDFLAGWGESAKVLDFVCRVPDSGLDWRLETHPRALRMTARQQAKMAIGVDRTHVDWEAEVAVTEGLCFQHEIEISGNAHVQDVSVLEGGIERQVHWWRDPGQNLVLRMDPPVSGNHRVRLRMSRPVSRARANAMVSPRLLGAELLADDCVLYRHSEALVELVETTGYTAWSEERTAEVEDTGRGRIVAALSRENPGIREAKILASVRLNRVRTRSSLMIQMVREANGWAAVADCKIAVQTGLLDAVRFGIPQEWSGPFEVQGDVDLELVDLPAQGRLYLVARPRSAVATQLDLRILGPLAMLNGDRVHAPDIGLLEAGRVSRFLVVPESVDGRPVMWEPSGGLQEIEFPDFLRPPGDGPFACYAAVGPRFRATLREDAQPQGLPEIRSAELDVAWLPSGRFVAEARIDLLPAGRENCRIRLQPGSRLVHVDVSRIPAAPLEESEGVWRIDLPATHLVQTVRVLYGGLPPAEQRQRGLAAIEPPQLMDIPGSSWGWTVIAPTDTQPLLQPGQTRVTIEDHCWRGLVSTAGLMEREAEILGDGDRLDAERWYKAWMARYAEGRQSWLEVMPTDSEETAARREELEEIDQRQQALARWLGVDPVSETAVSPGLMPLDPRGNQPDQAAELLAIQAEDPAPLVFRQVVSAGPGQQGRVVAASLLLALALIAQFWLPTLIGQRVTPVILGCVLGVAWCLWCWPRPIGLIAIACSLAAAIWWAAARRPRRRAAVSVYVRD